MEDLPHHLILDILSRLTDSTDVARCRLVSRTLCSVSRNVSSINLLCSLPRYLKYRSADTKFLLTPFKTIIKTLIFNSTNIESISIGVDRSLTMSYEDLEEDESEDDMYLVDVDFVAEWLPRVCVDLKSLSVSDFWVQSCWRRSDILGLISRFCHNLSELELKNAWLSVDGLNPLPTLTSLTLEFIRLDDEDLNKINTCFPFLQVLNLCGVGGLKEPKVHLLHLRSCQWTVSNVPLSLAIFAPSLATLRLKCIRPRSLVLETPSLSDLNLCVLQADYLQVNSLASLRSLRLESLLLNNLISAFSSVQTVEKLTLNADFSEDVIEMVSLNTLFKAFPNLTSLKVGPGAWSQFEALYCPESWEDNAGIKSLQEFVACIVVSNIDVTQSFIASILDKCTNLSEVTILVHQVTNTSLLNGLIQRCATDWPRLKWNFGVFKDAIRGSGFSEGWDLVWQTRVLKVGR